MSHWQSRLPRTPCSVWEAPLLLVFYHCNYVKHFCDAVFAVTLKSWSYIGFTYEFPAGTLDVQHPARIRRHPAPARVAVSDTTTTACRPTLDCRPWLVPGHVLAKLGVEVQPLCGHACNSVDSGHHSGAVVLRVLRVLCKTVRFMKLLVYTCAQRGSLADRVSLWQAHNMQHCLAHLAMIVPLRSASYRIGTAQD